MNQNYIVDKLTMSDLTTSGKIVIPSFQRGIVWTKAHRKEFIETVKSGDPFGVVLVSQASPQDPYILIDGLQRLSTLKAYKANPLEFIDENDKFIDADKLQAIFEEKYKSKGLPMPKAEKVEKEKKLFLKKMISLMKSKDQTPEALDIWPEMATTLNVTTDTYSVIKRFSVFYQSFMTNLDLPDIIIHAIVYQGPQERLPVVFEHLNTSSVTLTKYEVFSSQWPNKKIIVNDEDIISSVWGKYSGLKSSSSFDIDTTEESIRKEGITLFEYCFALSEILNDENKNYSYMFSKTKKSTDPTGFDILSLICGLPVNKADQLYKDSCLGGIYDGQFFTKLKNAITDSINIVNDAIKDFVFDIADKDIKNNNIYQIYHMIASVFKHAYNLDLNSGDIEKAEDYERKVWLSNFNKYAYKWYLKHKLSNFWNENRQVSDLRRILDDPKLSEEIYVTNISKSEWESVFEKYLTTLKDDATSRTIAPETKLVLNYFYKLLIREDENRVKYFKKGDDENVIYDIEHIVPVSKFKKRDEDVPMSTLGNLCYLPVKDNRSKRDMTIYEYALDRPSLTFNQDFLDMILYPKREELDFVDCSSDAFKEGFEKLYNSREEQMVNKLIEMMTR